MRVTAPLFALVSALLAGCSPEPAFDGRQAVGTMPKGFAPRPVGSPAQAAAYVSEYAGALGLRELATPLVLGAEGRYLVYAVETPSGRGAFSLEVAPEGAVRPNPFPAMEPEMMWNQKYGHRARLREPAAATDLTTEEARGRAAEALSGEPGADLGPAIAFYGYHLFPLRRGGQLVGQAAVADSDGRVVWRLLPPGTTVWEPPGARPAP